MQRFPQYGAACLLSVAGLLSACGGPAAEPTATDRPTSLPPTASAVPATATPVPDTATPRPSATATPRASTATPRPPTATPGPTHTPTPVQYKRELVFRSPGMQGADVEAVAERLRALGDLQNCRGLTVPPAGEAVAYEQRLAAAVRRFQERHGLPATSKVDRATWDALFSLEAVAAPARAWQPPVLGPAPAAPWHGLLAATRSWLDFNRAGQIIFQSVVMWDPAAAQIVATPAGQLEDSLAAAWSADGNWLAFISNRDGAPEVFVADAAGTQVVQLTCGAPLLEGVGDLAWSPDGTRLAYTGYSNIQIIALDGSGERSAGDIGTADGLAWSPDGARLAATVNGQLFVINLDGTGGYPVPGLPAYGVDWSPDSAWLVVSDGFNLWRLSPTGTDAAQLTAFTERATVANPSWSPDGGRLAFEYNGNPQGVFQLGVVNADGSGLGLLPANPNALFTQPEWQP